MKRAMTLCAAALCLTIALTPTALATDTGEAEVHYPTAITQSEDGTELRKLYDLGPEDDPVGIPRSDFEQDGFRYSLPDLLRQELRYRRQLIEDRREMVEEALLYHARHIDTAFYERSSDAPDLPSPHEEEEEGYLLAACDDPPEPPFSPDARKAATELETLMADLAKDAAKRT